jgi:enterochelin esterase family protein
MMKRVYRCLILLSVTAVLQTTNVFAQYPGSKQWPLVDGTSVTFLLKADAASDVQLYGDFLPGVNQYNLGGHVTMARNSEGLWEYKAENLPPDFYFYYYEVDGVRVLDPNNLHLVCNYSEYLNSFLVKGPESRNYELTGVPAGTVITHWYDSPEYSGQRRLNVWLPADYSETNRYPVLYMIPGGGDDEDTWVDMGRLPQIMSHLTASGEAVPMIVVSSNSNVQARNGGFGGGYSWEGMQNFRNEMIDNIIPFVEKNYRAKKDRKSRAMCGLSMGGGQSFYIGLRSPEVFANVGVFSTGMFGGIRGASNFDLEKEVPGMLTSTKTFNKQLDVFFVSCGEQDPRIEYTRNIVKKMREGGVEVKFNSYPGDHEWQVWRKSLHEFAQYLFKNTKK